MLEGHVSSHSVHEDIHCDRRSLRQMTMPHSKKHQIFIEVSLPSDLSVNMQKYARAMKEMEEPSFEVL